MRIDENDPAGQWKEDRWRLIVAPMRLEAEKR